MVMVMGEQKNIDMGKGRCVGYYEYDFFNIYERQREPKRNHCL